MKRRGKHKVLGYDWFDLNVTSEIYLNTHRADWWKACAILGNIVRNARSLIDIGGGDGHTLWQMLSVAFDKESKLKEVAFVEPSVAALKLARARLEQFPLSSLKFYKGILETLSSKLLAETKEPYDILYAGHVNYYFGKQTGGKYNFKAYEKALDLLPKLARTVIIMTAPRNSDYYAVISKNPFSEYVYSDTVMNFYHTRGYHIRTIKMPLRFYVAHAEKSRHEAIILWKFFHDTNRTCSEKELSQFTKRLMARKDAQGYINFKDELLIISR